MQNISYRITGCITSNAVASFQRFLGYPAEIVGKNANESFYPRRSDLYSCWLVEKGGRFWSCRYYPSEMTLAAVANSQAERRARRQIMALYPNTVKGQLQGLKHFTQLYIPAVKENKDLVILGGDDSVDASLPSIPRRIDPNSSNQLPTDVEDYEELSVA
jgi:hypothetical protein